MSKTTCTEITCHGRDKKQNTVFSKGEGVKVTLSIKKKGYNLNGDSLLETSVRCNHSCGSHGGGECKAGGEDNKGLCPYSFDIPYVIDTYKK